MKTQPVKLTLLELNYIADMIRMQRKDIADVKKCSQLSDVQRVFPSLSLADKVADELLVKVSDAIDSATE